MSRTKRRYNKETGKFGGKKVKKDCYASHHSRLKHFWQRCLNGRFRKEQKNFASNLQNNEDEPVPVKKNLVETMIWLIV